MRVTRAAQRAQQDVEEPVEIEAFGVYQLQDGDRVKLLHNVTIL